MAEALRRGRLVGVNGARSQRVWTDPASPGYAGTGACLPGHRAPAPAARPRDRSPCGPRSAGYHRLKGESLMLAGDETGASAGRSRTERHRYRSCDLESRGHALARSPAPSQQGAFLGMAIFTGKDIAHQPVRRLRDDQGFPRQGAALHLAQGFEAPFTRFNTVAINNFHAIPRQPGGAFSCPAAR